MPPPPHMHRINAVEQPIRTWKNHLILGLCDVGSFPPNAPIVPPPKTIPTNIDLIDSIKIKSETFSTNGIGRGFLTQQNTPCIPRQYCHNK